MPKHKEKKWIITDLLSWSTSYFESHKIDSPRTTSEILLAHILGLERIDLYLQFDKPLAADELANYKDLIKRRISREPVAYITGKKGFWSHEFKVSRDTLIPRPDTECIVEAVLKGVDSRNTEELNVLELGTGTGAIIISIAKELHGVFHASDISDGALEIAKINAKELGADVVFHLGSWFEPFENEKYGKYFDIIVSNPPYIPTGDIDGLEPEINVFEPHSALDGGEDGLSDLKKIIDCAPLYMREGGSLFLEMGFDQGEALYRYAEDKGCYTDIQIIRDYGDNPRVFKAVYKSLNTEI